MLAFLISFVGGLCIGYFGNKYTDLPQWAIVLTGFVFGFFIGHMFL